MEIFKDKTLSQTIKFLKNNISSIWEESAISMKTYYRIVNGNTKPTPRTIDKIANFLDLDSKIIALLIDNEIKSKK